MTVPNFPSLGRCALIRTDFDAEDRWQKLCLEASAETADGFSADFEIVNDRAFEGATETVIRRAFGRGNQHTVVAFAADVATFASDEHPVLVIHVLSASGRRPKSFRCVPNQLWSVENNLNAGNMDWAEFVDATGSDGVFRGFVDEIEVLQPPPSEIEIVGVAAARRMVRDMDMLPSARRLSGQRTNIVCNRVIVATPLRAARAAARVHSWITYAYGYADVPPYRYSIASRALSYRTDARVNLFGDYAEVRGRYLAVDIPRSIELTWEWYRQPPGPHVTFDKHIRVPDWETTVRFDLAKIKKPDLKTATSVTLTHTGVPAEWAADMAALWDWNLETMQQVLDIKAKK